MGAWQAANQPVLGPLTPEWIGLGLFLATYALLVTLSWDRIRRGASHTAADDDRSAMFLLGASIAAAFFFMSTHMHENHLFLTLPLLLVVAGRSARFARLAVACSLAIFLNELLHDLAIPYALPGILGASAPALNPQTGHPMTWLQFLGSYFNACLVAGIALLLCTGVSRGRNFTSDSEC